MERLCTTARCDLGRRLCDSVTTQMTATLKYFAAMVENKQSSQLCLSLPARCSAVTCTMTRLFTVTFLLLLSVSGLAICVIAIDNHLFLSHLIAWHDSVYFETPCSNSDHCCLAWLFIACHVSCQSLTRNHYTQDAYKYQRRNSSSRAYTVVKWQQLD